MRRGRALPAAAAAALLSAAARVAGDAEGRTDDQAYFAMGCFWRAWDLFRTQPGVREVRMGYMGGDQPYPTHRLVQSGQTKHLEVVEVHYDHTTSYKDLMHVWNAKQEELLGPHEEQGKKQPQQDKGPQYAAAVFPIGPSQRKLANQKFIRSRSHFYPAVAPVWTCRGDPPSREVSLLAEEGGKDEEAALRTVIDSAGGQADGHIFLTFAGKKDTTHLLNWIGHLEVRLGIQSYAVVCTDEDLHGFLAKRRGRCAASHENFRQPEHRFRFLNKLLALDLNIVLSEPSTVFMQNPMGIFAHLTSSKPQRPRWASVLLTRSVWPVPLAAKWGSGNKATGASDAPNADVSYWRGDSNVRVFVERIVQNGPAALTALTQSVAEWKKVGRSPSGLLAAALAEAFHFNGDKRDAVRPGEMVDFFKIRDLQDNYMHVQVGVLPWHKFAQNCGSSNEVQMPHQDLHGWTVGPKLACSFLPEEGWRLEKMDTDASEHARALFAFKAEGGCYTRRGTQYCHKYDDDSALPMPRMRKPFGQWLEGFIAPKPTPPPPPAPPPK